MNLIELGEVVFLATTRDQRFNITVRPDNGKRFFTLDEARDMVETVARDLGVDRSDVCIRGLLSTQWYTITRFDNDEFDLESYFESRGINSYSKIKLLQVIVRQN